MPAPDKTKMPKKLDKGKKSELGKKKKSSGNLMIILAAVGVVVLLAVGITIFFLMSGNDKSFTTPATGQNGAQLSRKTATEQPAAPSGEGAAPVMDMSEMTAKINEIIDKLTDQAKKDEAGRQLKDMFEGDLIKKVPNGRTLLLTAIMLKAKAGNDGAGDFLKQLARDTNNPTLAQAARKIYDENLLKEGEKTLALEGEAGEEPTSYIPNKADVVFAMKMNKFLESEFNRAVFTTGAFREGDVLKRLGVPANTVDQFIVSGIKDFNQVAIIVRTTIPMSWDDVKKTMHMEETGTTIKGKTYYLGKVDFMTEFLGQRIPGIEALRDKAAFWRVDTRTMVYADETTMKDLLENPPEKDKGIALPLSAALPGGDPNQVPTGAAGVPSGRPQLVPGSIGGEGATGGFRDNRNTAGIPGGGNNTASSTGGEKPARKERFLTIDAKLRRLIGLTQHATQDSLIVFADKATSKIPVLVSYVQYLDQLPSAKSKEIDSLVMVLPAVTGSPSLRVGVACKSRAVVRDVSIEIEKLLTRIGKDELRILFGYDFILSQQASENQANAGSGGTGGAGNDYGGVGGGGGRAGANDIGGINPAGGRAGGRAGGFGVSNTGGRGAGVDDANSGGGRRGNFGGVSSTGGRGGGTDDANSGSGRAGNDYGAAGPGAGRGVGNVPSQNPDEPLTDNGRFTVERSDEYILIVATMKSTLSEFIDKHMKGWMQQIRGSQEMASGKFRLGDLSASLEYYKNDLVRNNRPIVFPQGAYPRAFDAERGSRPYPASERVSFLRELLPYLGDERYFGMQKDIDPEQSWRSTSNLNYARILIPHFLNPAVGPNYSYVKVRGVDAPVATTHFVGMAGVGPDAAYLPKSDPRAGIFGYDRQTSPDDVKDGLSNTIYMIEADKTLLGPWLQGGGSTVRGTSMAGNDVGRRGGFSSPNFGGKAGVWVLMADGSARFLTKDISPEIFKALCTMAGSDSAGAIDLIATKANLEVTPRTETTSAISTQRKKKIVEEEEVPVKK
ncbi:MAG TPA: DUF1559 domain-containing protein [Gemmatales bacterium]|nr:DUF1559 domain-containing protein [Gemmatales bacterium]